MCDLADLYDEESGLMDLDDLTKSEMSLDQLPELPMSSPELFCVGCDISSKSDCHVEKLKTRRGIDEGTSTRIQWGKTSTRSVWRTGKKGRRYKKKC